jgi:hypothetical protein
VLNEKDGLTHLKVIQIKNMQIIVVPAEGYGYQANPYHIAPLSIQNIH